jgi:hypothetical protein
MLKVARRNAGFLVRLWTVIRPRPGLERDGVTARISLSTCKVSPGRVGRGQVSSPPAPINPPAMGMPLWTRSDMVIEAVCQPLAAKPWKKVCSASASSMWKGCGSNCAAKALIWSAFS